VIVKRLLVLAALAALLAPACAYFNSLYNAERLFDDARRAEHAGRRAEAEQAYSQSIEKAARALRSDPNGRWADDALFLIARARFARAEFAAAAAALERLLAFNTLDADMRAGANAYLGAARLRLGAANDAAAHLRTAVDHFGDDDGASATFARLWLARALFELGADSAAWLEIDRAARGEKTLAREARLEAATRAVSAGDSARARAGFAALLADAGAAAAADSIRSLAAAAARRWDAGFGRSLLASAAASPWPATARNELVLYRAELAAGAGDTAAARDDASSLAARAGGPIADRARVLLARWTLAAATDAGELADARAVLLPAVGDTEARTLLEGIRLVEALLAQARGAGQPLALFAAAELARDRLGSPGLARGLFLAYADLVPSSVWAPKALIAAGAASTRDQALRARLESYDGSVYVAALHGREDPADFASAEERLARTLAGILDDAAREARGRDAAVTQAIFVLDSIRAVARQDSAALACGILLDSLAVTGIRKDSVRAACLRGQLARIDTLLRVDTLLLRDTTELPRGPRRGVRDDTLFTDTIK